MATWGWTRLCSCPLQLKLIYDSMNSIVLSLLGLSVCLWMSKFKITGNGIGEYDNLH